MKTSIFARGSLWPIFFIAVLADWAMPVVFSAYLSDARVSWSFESSYGKPSDVYPTGIKHKLVVANVTILSEHTLSVEHSVRNGLVRLDYYQVSQASPEGIYTYTCTVANLNDDGSAVGYACFAELYAEESSAKARSREFHEVWESLTARRAGM